MELSLRAALFFAVAVALSPLGAHASNALPDACGADDVSFSTTVVKEAPLPTVPEGKSLLVFSATKSGIVFGPQPARFGVDGQWTGAIRFGGYMVVPVTAGEHHICFSVKGRKDAVGALSLTAEAGHSYFYEYAYVGQVGRMVGTGTAGAPIYLGDVTTLFHPLLEDEGRFRFKTHNFTTSKPSK